MPLLSGLKISLIFPTYLRGEDPAFFRPAKQNLGIIPPLSLAYVAAILERYGCKVEIIDASALNLSKAQALYEVNKFRPDFLGFTSSTFDFHHTLEWIKYLKDNTRLPVIIGGVHMSIYAKETLSHREIDYGVIGEAEETLPELLEYVVTKKDLSKVKGVCYREGDDIIITEKRQVLKNLDDSPFPARHLLRNERYYSLISKRKNFTAMITSRGCPFHCIFCDNHTILYRTRSPKNIVDEIEQCHNLFKINEIDIFDALFSVDSNRVVEICREIKQRRLEISWSFRTRVDLVDDRVLDELKEAGCIRIYYGIESGDPKILKNINKDVDIKMIAKTISLTKKRGIDTFGYFMIGNIGETKETIQKTLNLMLRLPLDYVQIAPVYAPPNTALYDMLREKIHSDYWQEYTLDTTKGDTLPRFGTNLSDKEIEKYVRRCYLKFYLRLSYVIKTILRLRSWNEFFRSIKAVRDMILSN